jgi:hypothetical protein
MLYKVEKRFNNGTVINELVYSEGAYSSKEQDIVYCNVNLFKYKYEGSILPPTLINSPRTGERFIVPTWQLVHPNTTLNDIEWVKPHAPTLKSIKYEVTGSNGDKYNTVFNPNTNKWKCSCPGSWRAKNGICKHIQAKIESLNK